MFFLKLLVLWWLRFFLALLVYRLGIDVNTELCCCLVSNFEVRFPFTGPEKIAAIKSGVFFTDLNFFFDAGVAWGESAYYGVNRTLSQSKIITSTGASMRINLFGQLILEPYYAFPLQLKGNNNGVFGLVFAVGW